MRALAITGIETASLIPSIMVGSLMRATPPSRRMSAGTRSSAITAAAPASSAIVACSGVTTSMITPPLSISARPALTLKVPVSMYDQNSPRRCGIGLFQPESLDSVRVGRLVERVYAIRKGLDEGEEGRGGAHVGGAVGRVVELVVRKFGPLGQRGVGDRDRGGPAVAPELDRAHHERVWTAGREADHHGLVVDPAELGEALLAGRGHHLGAQVQQHQEVAQVAREERHLVRAAEHDALRARDQVHGRGDLVAIDLAGGLGHVRVIGAERRLELGLVNREERLRRQVRYGRAVLTRAPVLVARRRLKLREALEAERLREADDRRARGVGAARQLLRGVERRLLQMVDDVLPDVLLRAAELVEALADLLGEREGSRSGTRHARGFRRNLCSSFHGARPAAQRSLSRTASL